MDIRMPRGAIPTPRSELAASEPYRPDTGAENFVPSSSEFPTPNFELAGAEAYKASGPAPESFLAWPVEIAAWGNGNSSSSNWAEEAFAKACAEPKVFLPLGVVRKAAEECGTTNFARFMQTRGFEMNNKAYCDGPFLAVDWTNTAALNGAIAAGPVKIGVTSANLHLGGHGRITPGKSGWAVYGLVAGQPGDLCASLCGYGELAALTGLFAQHGVHVEVPAGMPAGLCYAMFISGSVGVIDRESMVKNTGEAWARHPTTVVKDAGG